jgi:hypothetical protein
VRRPGTLKFMAGQGKAGEAHRCAKRMSQVYSRVEPRRYYVIGSEMVERGPFTHEELGKALAAQSILPSNQVRTSMGTMLGTVATVLRSRPTSEPRPRRVGGSRGVPRSTAITLAAIGVLLLLITIMAVALHTSAPPQIAPPAGGGVTPVSASASATGGHAGTAPAAATPAGPPPVPLGIHPRMSVSSVLQPSDPVWALKVSDQGGASHRAAIANGEVAANALDGNLATKYYTFFDDDRHAPGIGSGLVVSVRSAVVVTALQFATANDENGRDPVAITLEGSNQAHAEDDGSAAFTLIYAGSTGLEADPGRQSWGPAVVFANVTAFRTYRLLVTRKRDPGTFGLQYSEFRLGSPAP